MNFALSEEQRMIVETTRAFVENELYPHESEIERTGELRPELRHELKDKAVAAGLYAANMPAEVGGAGLDTVSWVLYEKELGKANYALQLRRAALEHPDGLCRRAAPALSPALRQRREIRLPRHDRAGDRFRHPQHEDIGGARRLRFCHKRR